MLNQFANEIEAITESRRANGGIILRLVGVASWRGITQDDAVNSNSRYSGIGRPEILC
jgi:hypothetical protein